MLYYSHVRNNPTIHSRRTRLNHFEFLRYLYFPYATRRTQEKLMKSLPTHSLYCNRSRDWISNGSYDECVAHAERFMSSKPWQYAFMILKIGS